LKIEGVFPVSQQFGIKNSNNEAVKVQPTEGLPGDKQEQAKNDIFPGEKQFIDVIEKSNKDLKMTNSSLQFSIHEKTKEIVVKIIDNETKEVIREIPPEKILDMVAAMLEKTGLFVDKQA